MAVHHASHITHSALVWEAEPLIEEAQCAVGACRNSLVLDLSLAKSSWGAEAERMIARLLGGCMNGALGGSSAPGRRDQPRVKAQNQRAACCRVLALLLISASCQCASWGRQWWCHIVVESLPPVWETKIKFLAASFGLAQSGCYSTAWFLMAFHCWIKAHLHSLFNYSIGNILGDAEFIGGIE